MKYPESAYRFTMHYDVGTATRKKRGIYKKGENCIIKIFRKDIYPYPNLDTDVEKVSIKFLALCPFYHVRHQPNDDLQTNKYTYTLCFLNVVAAIAFRIGDFC